MLKLILTAAGAGTLIAMTYLPAAAHEKGSVDLRQARQAAAIEQGRITGQITWSEGIKLRNEQRRIARLEAKFRKSDGHLDRYEKAVLNDLLNDARKHIRLEKRDSHRRYSALPRIGR
jgi:hypothetical protein